MKGRVNVQMVLYRAEAWGVRYVERRKVNVIEMKCLTSFVGVSRWIEFGIKWCV